VERTWRRGKGEDPDLKKHPNDLQGPIEDIPAEDVAVVQHRRYGEEGRRWAQK